VHVLDVLFEDDRAAGVRIKGPDGVDREVRARVVVDASGQAALLQNRLKLRVWDPVLNKGAIWTYWQGARRDSGQDEGATMVLQTSDRQGWFWYIPLHDDRVSVGVVAPFDALFKGRNGHERTFHEEVERCPVVKERLSPGRRITGYFATRDYSYRSREVAGHGWVLVGDAFGFLDPLYSSGVLLALKSGELAAEAIADGLSKGDVSAAQLGRWGEPFNQGVDRMRRLVCEYYDGFSFSTFVREYPELQGTVTDILIGDLFTERLDKLWGPVESLYPPGKGPIPAWNAGLDAELVPSKANELLLPAGPRP
jgi:flavin-dependent dehydrogenase